ncbi:MAG: acyl-ACP--UDP-N-acetylglucosamine O-acyltransferase [Phycisphaerales bacterium]|nr:acyl-ACP--UDP-N-acetylglucosamine O-acyltransferase [Phycisphaerae bacterium]NNF42902.1 acyl-ACP--UDP-N-acetylglucosamine O-acyltransferase [Phycisphaerales bacterium]NNM26286.1 acyl-ACP--UDP-N-acetylglucosamine O-acyltransferase [Phycisphaerales bacterium]
MSNIHPTAIVDPSAVIADSVTIGAYCTVGPDVVIGARTVLHNHVVIHSLTTIGEGNEFFPFTVIGADPQDMKFNGEHATCVIGNDNVIREHVTIHRGTANGGGVTRMGNQNLVMVAAHLAHDSVIGSEIVIANQVMIAGHVRVEDGASIGGGVGVHHFTTIGSCAFVGGLARIAKDVPPFMIVEGNPAEVRAINSIAMTRRGYPAEHIDAVKDAFKRLYRDNGAPMVEKLEQLRGDYPEVPAVLRLCDSLAATADGVHGRALENFRHDDKRAIATAASH